MPETWLTDALGRDDPDCLAHLYRLAGGHIGAVAFCADTDVTSPVRNRAATLGARERPALVAPTRLDEGLILVMKSANTLAYVRTEKDVYKRQL